MSEIKIGDKVRLLKKCGGAANVGDVGVYKADRYVDFPSQKGYGVPYIQGYLELVESARPYKVGDKVRIQKPASSHSSNGCRWTSHMDEFDGKVLTLRRLPAYSKNWQTEEAGEWYFSEEWMTHEDTPMLTVGQRKFKDGDTVHIVKDLSGHMRGDVGKVCVVLGYDKGYVQDGRSYPYRLSGELGGTIIHANVQELELVTDGKPGDLIPTKVETVAKKKKRLFKDGQAVYVKSSAKAGTIVRYRKGEKFPYVVELPDGGRTYHSYKGLLKFNGTVKPEVVERIVEKRVEVPCTVYEKAPCDRKHYKAEKPKKGHIMSSVTNLREKVRAVLRSADETLLIRTGFVYESGALTKEGRKVVADLQFQGVPNEDLREKVVDLAKKLDEDCKKK